MTIDPYPDLVAGEPTDPADGPRLELSEADSRLLHALTQPQPAVVSAVEDEAREDAPSPSARAERTALRRASGRAGGLVPVFQEPAG